MFLVGIKSTVRLEFQVGAAYDPYSKWKRTLSNVWRLLCTILLRISSVGTSAQSPSSKDICLSVHTTEEVSEGKLIQQRGESTSNEILS